MNALPASAPLTMHARTPVPLLTVSAPTWTVATALLALTVIQALAALIVNAHPTVPPAPHTLRTATALKMPNAPAPSVPPATPARTLVPPLKALAPTMMAATAPSALTVCPQYAQVAPAYQTVPAVVHLSIPASVPATPSVCLTSVPPTYANLPAWLHKDTVNTKMDVSALLSMSADLTIVPCPPACASPHAPVEGQLPTPITATALRTASAVPASV